MHHIAFAALLADYYWAFVICSMFFSALYFKYEYIKGGHSITLMHVIVAGAFCFIPVFNLGVVMLGCIAIVMWMFCALDKVVVIRGKGDGRDIR